MDGWIDGYMDGCMDGWMDRWMDRWMEVARCDGKDGKIFSMNEYR